MRYTIRIVLALALLSCAPYVLADSINVVPYSSLTGTGLITFDDVAGGPMGTNYDGILMSGGASFAERFVGQNLSFDGDFDVLSGTPVGPLALQTGVANQNVSLIDGYLETNILAGVGPVGFPDFDAIGEGSVAMLFVFDQSQLGFFVHEADGVGGSETVNFFRRDGSLIQTIALTTVCPPPQSLRCGMEYGFQREGGVKDIAGVSIHNNDFNGIGIDIIKHDVPATVPEPSTLVLLGVGAMAGATRRWVRRKHRP